MSGYPLPTTDLNSAGLREDQVARLHGLIEGHIKAGHYPGAQIAIARHGKLAHFRSFGEAALGRPAADDTLWLLFSNTKVITAAACWVLAERGAFRFTDRMADHVPGFARNGKGDVTILQVITHTGGFPNAEVPAAAWEDHALMREAVCDYSLEFTPGSRLHYHGASAHWALAVLIEQLTGQDFRDFIRTEVTEKMGLGDEMKVGVPEAAMARTVEMYAPKEGGGIAPLADRNAPAFKRAGVPGGGGYATARGMVAFYQMMLAGGTIGGARIVGPRTLGYAIRNWTGDMHDHAMNQPMHRGLGPHLRGTTPTIRGLGSFASPGTFGHGGAGNSYCWADPEFGCVVRLPHELPGARPVAQPANGRGQQLRPLGDPVGTSRPAVAAGYWARKPPSTASVWPVTMPAAGLARNRMAVATSSGSASRPIGVTRSISATTSALSSSGAMKPVRTQVGATAFTRMPWRAHSTASARVMFTMAPLVVW